MSSDDEWTEADFEPPERPVGSLEELRASLVGRVGGDAQDALWTEDVLLFVCVRRLQGRPTEEVENELAAWGLPRDEVVGLIGHVRMPGRLDLPDAEQKAIYRGRATAVWRSPAFEAKRHLAIRAASRYRLACELAGRSDPAEALPEVDLGFTPDQLPTDMSPRVRGALRLRAYVAVLIAVSLFTALAYLVVIYLSVKAGGG